MSCTKKRTVCSMTETPVKWLTDFLTDSSETICQWGIVIQLVFFCLFLVFFPQGDLKVSE